MASYYVEILEKSIKRLVWGKQQGLWQTGIFFISNRLETVSRGAAVLSSIFSGDKSSPEAIRCRICSKEGEGVSPFTNCYHSKELKSFVSFPNHEYPGFCLYEQAQFDVDFETNCEKSIPVGNIMTDQRLLDSRCFASVDDLTKHALVAGVTGSGKTNSILSLLINLYHSHKIPFLVIEPAKSEYRNLLIEIDSLLIFTLGEERPNLSAPFRLNPFAFPEGISLQTHIDYLKAVFNAAFVMYAPMPYVLEDCLYRIYEDKGWNLVTSTNFRGRNEMAFPTLEDLYQKIDEVVEDIGYQGRTTMDIKAALKTRVKNLCLGGKGMMLNSRYSVPFSEIMTKPTVLELKYLGNDEEKAFMMGLILTSILEHYESLRSQDHRSLAAEGLSHLTVIEEAHRLLKNVPTEKSTEEMSNIKGKGIETFCNVLAEIRAYGEGVLISEQIPSKLASDVIKNSSLKIMHRLVSKEDRELMGDTMNLNHLQKRQAISLQAGEALFFSEGLDRPLMIKAPLSKIKNREITAGSAFIHKRMKADFFNQHKHLLIKFPACSDCPHQQKEECEIIKRRVEEVILKQDMEQIGVKFFLPFLLKPENIKVMEHLETIVDLNDISFYCFSAYLIGHYMNAKGDFLNLPFSLINKVTNEAHGAIGNEKFARIIGSHYHEQASHARRRYPACKEFCRNICLLGYEGSILAKDAPMHNKLVDLLDSPEYGIKFYQELAILVVDFLRNYLPSDYNEHLSDLAVCWLIGKLNNLRFSISLQNKIIKTFAEILACVCAGN